MQLKFRELKEEGLKNNKRVDQFEGEGKSSATRTFARELLQNTLDARLDKESPAKVNFKIIENHQSKLINDLREDLDLALTNSHSKDDESSKNLLLIEEFGTVGLNGPIGPRKDSNHANFWSNSGSRAGRGKQSKESTTLGGAGVGNIALFLVSGLKTILVYTVRNKVDSSELCIDEEIPQYVMGKIELRDSWLVDNKNDDSPGYTYEGFYSNQDQHGNTIPETDPQEINRFKDIFKLERKPNEIGTSFVIPDIHKEITKEFLIENILEEYFYSIYSGKLEINVDEVQINPKTLEAVCEEYLSTESNHPNASKDFRQFQTDAETFIEEKFIQLKDDWKDNLENNTLLEDSFIDQDSLKQAKRDFEEGEVVGIKVPINIFPHELNEGKYIPKKTVISYANFYIQKNSDTLTMLLRQGLIISEEPLKLTRLPVFSLLLIEEASLSKFALRAERDNHVKFDFKKNELKAEYSKPRNTVTELRSSFDVLPKFFFGIGASLDRDLLLDVLRVPVLGLPNATPSTTPSPAPTPIPITPPAPPRKEYIVMDDANGWGMNNKSDTPLPYLPFNMEVTMVYAVHETLYNSKAKVKEYDPLDFNLNNELVFSFHTEGLEYEVIDGHKLTLEINKHEFFIEITGFPESKRVIATVEYKESGEEDGI